ncbi:MAG: UDP-N-acetylmuramate dehydrogenase [Bdellovibrionales bacterium]
MDSLPPFISAQVSLAHMTSWLVGGNADFLAQPENVEDLKRSVEWANQKKLAITVLGGGTNVLVSDAGVRGLVISTRKLRGHTIVDETHKLSLEVLAGTPKSVLLKLFLSKKLAPALFLAGLPGDVGGGVVMNAGVGEAMVPREFVEIVDWVEVLRDGQIHRYLKADLQWDYRHCEGWRPGIVTKVGVSWPMYPHEDIVTKVKAANMVRLQKQPLDMPSCGSVFINPPGFKSGMLVEECGLKGFTIGGAQVSTKHANFIVNVGGATAHDIHAVIQYVKKTVKEKKSVELNTEVVYLGDW